MYARVLVANRGEIACRVIRTCRRLGVGTVAVHSEADAAAAHVAMADAAVAIGPAPAAESYLRQDRIIAAALATGAEAIHPGYGFLSENAAFAQAVLDAGLGWIGPAPATIAALGDKAEARAAMAAVGLPVSAGGLAADAQEAEAIARRIGFPVMVKAAAGGGGMGMRIAHAPAEIAPAFAQARSQAERFFGDGSILVERYLPAARHVEIQVLGLPGGEVLTLGERDCSIQRRFQKLIEETPSPALSQPMRQRMAEAARTGAQSLGFLGAGTFEFLVSGDDFVFLEVNARLQVEHTVTELVTGLDLVEAQLRIACGDSLGFDPAEVTATGHAIQLRICAEDPVRFLPGGGRITEWKEPAGEGIRVDSGYRAGDEVTPFYDSLMAKLCAHGPTRAEAIDRAARALDAFAIAGPKRNSPFLARVLASEAFRSGAYDVTTVAALQAEAAAA